MNKWSTLLKARARMELAGDGASVVHLRWRLAGKCRRVYPACRACGSTTIAPSVMQPRFCMDCVQAMLRGRRDRLDVQTT